MIDAITFRLNSSTADDISAHLAACDEDFIPPLGRRIHLATYASKLARKAARFEGWAGKELAGLVAAYCNEEDRQAAFVSSVSVAPSWRRSGIGNRLIENCLDHATALGFAWVELRVAAANAGAVQLYYSHGFRSCGREGTELIMRRKLSPP